MIKNSTQHQWEQVEDPGPSFTHFVNTDGETQTIIVQTTNEPVQVTNATLHVQPEPRRKIFLESKKAKLEKEAKRNAFIEVVSAYKCRLCQFVAMFCQDVEQHLLDCHHEEYLDANDWLQVALREKIPLECPRCDNHFISEGSR